MPSRDPKDMVPLLQEFWPKLAAWYETKFPDRILILTCTARSVAEQQAIFKQNAPGKILTRCDGIKIKSKHNYIPAQAFDCAVKVNGKVVWGEVYYKSLGLWQITDGLKEYMNRIRWGGTFSFKDYPHWETV